MTSCRLKILATAAVFAGAVAFTFTGPPAFAVDGDGPPLLGLFELDGDPQDIPAGVPDDWDTLFGDCSTPGDPNCGASVEFTGILADPGDPSDPTIFTGGGSKDIKDISVPGETSNAWLHDSGSSPDKDDITNAYAAAYLAPEDVCVDTQGTADPSDDVLADCPPAGNVVLLHQEDDLIIYFGADRFDNNGDAFLGFWFFQDSVSLTTDPLKGGFEFDGNHMEDDVLVLVEFPQGANAAPEIKVLKWDPDDLDTDNVANNLDLLITAEDALCDGTGGKLACAITNDEIDGSPPDIGPVDSPWPYLSKDGDIDLFPFETFYSGGINLTALLGETLCISTFMAETRSSRSETAQLKDFVLGDFQLCGIEVTKVGTTTSKEGDPVDWTITVTNTGFVSLFAQDITDDVLGNLLAGVGVCSGSDNTKVTSCTIDTDDCGPAGTELLGGDSCVITVSGIVADGAPDPLDNNVDILYTSDVGGFGDEFLASADHSVNLFQPNYTLAKSCLPAEVVPGEDITYTYTLTNTSSTDTPTLNLVSAVDDLFGDVSALGTPTWPADLDGCISSSCVIEIVHTALPADVGNSPIGGDIDTRYDVTGFTNMLNRSDNASCAVIKLDSKIATEIRDSNNDVADIQNTTVKVGITVHDFVIVSELNDTASVPEPTGNVTVDLFVNALCSGLALDETVQGVLWPQVVALNGPIHGINGEKGTAETGNFTPLGNTALSFKVTYLGDDVYNGSESGCEQLAIEKFDPKVDTHIIIRDKALVSAAPLGPNPTLGDPTVTFEFFTSSNCTAGQASLGADQDLPGSGMVESVGEVTINTLGATTIRSFRATYNGNADYNPGASDCELVSTTLPPAQ